MKRHHRHPLLVVYPFWREIHRTRHNRERFLAHYSSVEELIRSIDKGIQRLTTYHPLHPSMTCPNPDRHGRGFGALLSFGRRSRSLEVSSRPHSKCLRLAKHLLKMLPISCCVAMLLDANALFDSGLFVFGKRLPFLLGEPMR